MPESSRPPPIVIDDPVVPGSTSDNVEPLHPPRPHFVEHFPSTSDSDDATSPSRPRKEPSRSALRAHNRNQSNLSKMSGTSTPRTGTAGSNPFATPTAENGNPFSPPASVVSFSIEADPAIGQSYPFPDPSHRHDSVQSSKESSAVDLRQRPTSAREAFSAPPSRPSFLLRPSSSGNNSVRTRPSKKPRPVSTMLNGPIVKPWVEKKDVRARLAYFLTYGMILVGCAAAAIRCYFGWRGVPLLGRVCLVMEDNFDGTELNPDIWMREVDLGGFGNGEFEMTTSSTNNSFIKNNQLYLLPTLTSDVIGRDAVFDGYTYNLTGCTNANLTACGTVSNATAGTVVNPVMSARLSTKGKKSIQYGRVEVRAKLPLGDWMWPAIWMLPENDTYGAWPLSGEIDIMEARGNDPSYPAQGINFVRGSLNWGPISWLNEVSKTFGWWTERRSRYSDDFHTYALEWSPDFLRIYVDSRLQHMLDLRFDVSFFDRGDFPVSVLNGSQEIVLNNPWEGRGNSAPFDKPFYLILDVAVGGTNGWFPDGAGKKPWLNGALNAMRDFAEAQDQWYSTWPQDEDDRAMRIDSIKMWQSC